MDVRDNLHCVPISFVQAELKARKQFLHTLRETLIRSPPTQCLLESELVDQKCRIFELLLLDIEQKMMEKKKEDDEEIQND